MREAAIQPYDALFDRIRQHLADLWCELLQRDQVGFEDNFFELGGDSIKLQFVVAHIEEHFEIELPLGTVFANPTIGAVAPEVLAAMAAAHAKSPELQTNEPTVAGGGT